MTRTADHIDAIAGLIEDLEQEKRQGLLSLSAVILFGGVTAAALIMMLQFELHFLLPFILGLSITAMGGCYGVDSLARIRSLKRQIEIIHEDTKL
jgi:hypothetical protein